MLSGAPSTGHRTVSWLEQHALRTPDREALVDLETGRSESYADLWARVRSLAHGLQTRFGVGVGDRVAILSRNDTRVVETLYACALIGAVTVPLNWRLTAVELAAIVADAAPRVLVAEDGAAETVAEIVASHEDALSTLSWHSDGAGADDFEELATTTPDRGWTPPEVGEDAVWTIIYTSGTTGVPKGVQATHRAMNASMLGILVAHGVSSESRTLTVLPTFHVAGLNLFTNPVLYAGGTVLVARAFDPAETLRLLRDAEPHVTHFCGVPANYQFIEQLPGIDARPLRPFVAVVGGSPVPASLLTSWRERGVPLSTVYGITEAGACVAAVPATRPDGAPGTVGVPVLHARCRIRSAEGGELPPGQVGELEIAGDTVTVGYWNKPEATAETFTDDGWLRTGDAAYLSEDGQLVLVDRWKDMYISGGENVYPAEVENVLVAHPEVAQAAVVGVPDERWGESGVAFVMVATGATCDEARLRAWCQDRLARYKVPARVVVVDDLPRNATGKTLKADLRDRARTLQP